MNFHGGNVHDFSQKLIDFSSNINPLGVPDSFKTALLGNLEEFTKYPDIQYIQLRKAIAEYLNIESINWIIPGNGAVELLYRAVQQSGKKKLISLKPTFSEYSRAAFQGGMEYIPLNAFNEDYTEVDIKVLLQEADQDSAVIICNPNNPTGTLIEKDQLLLLASCLREKGALLIMDEAFMEFAADYPKDSMLDQIDYFDNLIIIKAATKFFGMPGIRLGYAVSSNQMLLNGIKDSLEPWNVNTAAVLAGSFMLKDVEYISKSREWISLERTFMYEGLKNVANIVVYPSAANFHLVKLLDANLDAWKLKAKLLTRNILIRTPDGFDGLNGQFVRLAVKSRQDNVALLEALQEVL